MDSGKFAGMPTLRKDRVTSLVLFWIPIVLLGPVRPANANDQATAIAVEQITKLGGAVRPMTSIAGAWDVAFHIRGRGLTDDGLRHVAALKRIGALNLRDTKITDDGLMLLRKITGLRRLHLERTKISDRGTHFLAGCTELEYLNLYGTGISDATLDRLAKLKNLKSLYVWQTKVTDAGVERLQAALPRVRVVRGVDLSKLPAYAASKYEPPKPKEDLKWNEVGSRDDVPKSETGINTQVFFENRSGEKVKLYWVTYGNELKLYAELEPGVKRQQNTYSRNTWLITNQKEKPLGYFLVGVEISRAVIPPLK